MKVNCISCGHSISLDEAYDDFSGYVKCYVCGGMLEIKTADGKLSSVNLAGVALSGQSNQAAPSMSSRQSGQGHLT